MNVANGNVIFMLPGAGYRFSGIAPSPGLPLYFNTGAVGLPGDFTGGLGLGSGWSCLLGTRVDFPAPDTAVFTGADGARHHFSETGGTWEPQVGSSLELVPSGSGWIVTDGLRQELHLDTQGRCTKIASAQGNECTVQWNGSTPVGLTEASGRPCSVALVGGKLDSMTIDGPMTWNYTYDAQGRLDGVDVSGVGSTSLAYDAQGLIASITDASNHTWQFDYYTSGVWAGRIETITNPAGDVESYSYTLKPDSFLTKLVGTRGETWRFFHDDSPPHALIRWRDGRGELWKRQYDADMRVVADTDPLGQRTEFRYDAEGNLDLRTPPSGNASSFSYDARGNVRTASRAGLQQEFVYGDPENPDLPTLRYEPADTSGNRAATHYSYYGFNDGPGNGALMGKLKSVVDPNGVETRFEYGNSGFIRSIAEGPLGSTGGVELRYDLGLLPVYEDLGGQSVPSHFPALPPLPSGINGELEQLELDPLATDWRGLHDSIDLAVASPLAGTGGAESSLVEVDATRDHYGRVDSATVATDEPLFGSAAAPGTQITRSYQTAYHDGSTDPRMVITSPEGDVVTTRVDDAGRVIGLVAAGASGESLTLDLARRADGRISSLTRSDGVTGWFTYEPDGQPDVVIYSRNGVRFLTLIHDYDAAGLLETATEYTSSGSVTKQYDYDSQKRLTSELLTYSDGTSLQLVYTYDAGGNRRTLERLEDGVAVEINVYHYDLDDPVVYESANNRLMWVERLDGAGTLLEREWYFYDNRFGNVSRVVRNQEGSSLFAGTGFRYGSSGQPWLSWDEFWQDTGTGPTQLVRRQILETRQYGMDKWLWRRLDPNTLDPVGATEWTTRFGSLSAAYTVDLATGTTSRMHFEIDGLGRLGAGTTETYTCDPLGTVRARHTGAANVAQESTAFGDALVTDLGSDFRFAGGFGVRSSHGGSPFPGGLVHMGHRHYAPRHGRFLMRDPLGVQGGINTYGFVNNTPTGATDASGLTSDVGDWIDEKMTRLSHWFWGPPRPPAELVPRPAPAPTPDAEPAEVVLEPVTPRTGRTPASPPVEVEPPAPEPPPAGPPVMGPPYIPTPVIPGFFDEDFNFKRLGWVPWQIRFGGDPLPLKNPPTFPLVVPGIF